MASLLMRVFSYCVAAVVVLYVAFTLGERHEVANACSGCEDGDGGLTGFVWGFYSILVLIVVIVIVELVVDRRSRRVT